MGVLLFFMKRCKFPLAPLVIAFVLGSIIEKEFRRSLTLSQGKLSIFYQSTCSKVILVILIVFTILPIIKVVSGLVKKHKEVKND